jgi:hypothetical protein
VASAAATTAAATGARTSRSSAKRPQPRSADSVTIWKRRGSRRSGFMTGFDTRDGQSATVA